MNNLTSFLAITAIIFVAVIALLVLLSHLESDMTDREVDGGS